jgi:hypothetical protein
MRSWAATRRTLASGSLRARFIRKVALSTSQSPQRAASSSSAAARTLGSGSVLARSARKACSAKRVRTAAARTSNSLRANDYISVVLLRDRGRPLTSRDLRRINVHTLVGGASSVTIKKRWQVLAKSDPLAAYRNWILGRDAACRL